MNQFSFVALIAVLIVSACGGPQSVPTEGPVAVYEAVGEGGDAALLEGAVRVADGCVTVVPDGSAPVVPVFADTSSPRVSGRELTVDGNVYADSSRIELGGGFAAGTVRELTREDGRYIPDDCDRGLTAFIVAQPD